ncbi:MAG: hypothetical protein QM734_00260 [Cyclobacteriaceae bacterium]
MYSLQFWKEWPRPYQILFWIFSGLFLISLALFWYGCNQWPAPAITYDHYQQLQSLEVQVHSFNLGLIKLTVTAENNLIFENIFGSALHPSVFGSYFFLSTLVILFIIFMSVLPALSRYRFLMGVGIAALFIASLQVDLLQIFGLTGRIITIVLILLTAALAFYFHSFRIEATFTYRFFAFAFLTAFLSLIIFFFRQSANTIPSVVGNWVACWLNHFFGINCNGGA